MISMLKCRAVGKPPSIIITSRLRCYYNYINCHLNIQAHVSQIKVEII